MERLDMMRSFGKHFDAVGRYPSEDNCLHAVGIDSEDKYDGSMMPEFYENDEWDKIRSHCRDDVEEMVKLFCKEPEINMKEFYDHYNIDAEAKFTEEVEF